MQKDSGPRLPCAPLRAGMLVACFLAGLAAWQTPLAQDDKAFSRLEPEQRREMRRQMREQWQSPENRHKNPEEERPPSWKRMNPDDRQRLREEIRGQRGEK